MCLASSGGVNPQCTGLAEMVCNPEFIIQGLLGLQLARHQQAFLLGREGVVERPLPHRLKPAGGKVGWGEGVGFEDCRCTGMKHIIETDDV